MNARQELLKVLEQKGKNIGNIILIKVRYEPNFRNKVYINNLDDLDFIYDSGFGGQELFGYILLDDGDWLERHEYDGAEWWEYKKYPWYLFNNDLREDL